MLEIIMSTSQQSVCDDKRGKWNYLLVHEDRREIRISIKIMGKSQA